MSRSSSSSVSTTLAVSIAVVGTAVVSYCYHRIIVNRLACRYDEKRLAERKGRIRAEVKLRSALKHQNTNNDSNSTTLKCIGTVVSPFTKRMGTPRQGALAPSSRGYIDLTVAPQAFEGIQEYSHVWVVFEFHANTDIQGESRKTKVKPPRAPIKVGHLATRSPHRPNPIGLSLVKVEGVKGKRLYISALDLVNGTPVYDIKPCVPWDIPGYFNGNTLKVPEWVSQNDALPRVEFEQAASEALQDLMANVSLVYSKSDFELVQKAIQEILAQDPRSGPKRRSTDTTIPYNVMFGSVRVEFIVESSGTVRVIGVQPIEFPEKAYVDGIPLASELEMNGIPLASELEMNEPW